MQLHAQAVSGAEGDRGEEFECLAGQDAQAIALGDGGQDENPLHHREVIADANARAVAEREVGAARQPLDQVIGPAPRDGMPRVYRTSAGRDG